MCKKRVWLFAFAIALFLGIAWAGWAGGAGEKPSVVPEISSIIGREAVDDIKENAPVQKYLEGKYGVKFKITTVATDQRLTTLGLMIASGDFPDVVWLGQDDNARGFYDQGALGGINIEDFKKYAPKSYDAIVKIGQQWDYNPFYQYTFDGKVASWSSGAPRGFKEGVYVRTWRMDLLKALGINDVPLTLNDMEEIGRRQKAKDPKVYMMGGCGKDVYWQFATDIYNAFAYNPGDAGNWIYKDGKITNILVMPEFKDALSLLARWYKEGYIDPEWLTTGWDDHLKQFVNGQVLSHLWSHVTYAYPEGGYAYKMAKDINPNAEVVAAPWVLGPKGTNNGWPTGNPRGDKGGRFFSKKMAADPVKMMKYFQILEGYNYDDETLFTTRYGIKGIHWDPDPVVGAKPRDAKYATPPLSAEIGITRLWGFMFSVSPPQWERSDKYMTEEAKTRAKWVQAFIDKYPANFKAAFYPTASVTPLPQDLTRVAAEIKPMVREYVDGIILGKKEVSEWDGFVKKWLDAGGQKLSDFVNTNDLKFYKK